MKMINRINVWFSLSNKSCFYFWSCWNVWWGISLTVVQIKCLKPYSKVYFLPGGLLVTASFNGLTRRWVIGPATSSFIGWHAGDWLSPATEWTVTQLANIWFLKYCMVIRESEWSGCRGTDFTGLSWLSVCLSPSLALSFPFSLSLFLYLSLSLFNIWSLKYSMSAC